MSVLEIPPRYTPEKSLGTFSTSTKRDFGKFGHCCRAWNFVLILSSAFSRNEQWNCDKRWDYPKNERATLEMESDSYASDFKNSVVHDWEIFRHLHSGKTSHGTWNAMLTYNSAKISLWVDSRPTSTGNKHLRIAKFWKFHGCERRFGKMEKVIYCRLVLTRLLEFRS